MNPNYDIYEKRSKKNRESNRSIEPIESETSNKLFSNLHSKENVKLLNTIVEYK